MTGQWPAPSRGREVEVRAPGGRRFRFRLADDDTAVVLVDGEPAVGIDAVGPGVWRDGEVWERFGGGTVADRYLVAFDMHAEQVAGLATWLGLPPTWFGRFRGGPGEPRDVSFDSGEWSCGSAAALDLAIGYIRETGLGYAETRTVRYPPRVADAKERG